MNCASPLTTVPTFWRPPKHNSWVRLWCWVHRLPQASGNRRVKLVTVTLVYIGIQVQLQQQYYINVIPLFLLCHAGLTVRSLVSASVNKTVFSHLHYLTLSQVKKNKFHFLFSSSSSSCLLLRKVTNCCSEGKLDPYFYFYFFLAAPVAQVVKPVTRTTPWKFGVITAADIFLRDPWVPVLLSTVLVRSIHSPCVYLKWCKVSFWMCVSTTY